MHIIKVEQYRNTSMIFDVLRYYKWYK